MDFLVFVLRSVLFIDLIKGFLFLLGIIIKEIIFVGLFIFKFLVYFMS